MIDAKIYANAQMKLKTLPWESNTDLKEVNASAAAYALAQGWPLLAYAFELWTTPGGASGSDEGYALYTLNQDVAATPYFVKSYGRVASALFGSSGRRHTHWYVSQEAPVLSEEELRPHLVLRNTLRTYFISPAVSRVKMRDPWNPTLSLDDDETTFPLPPKNAKSSHFWKKFQYYESFVVHLGKMIYWYDDPEERRRIEAICDKTVEKNSQKGGEGLYALDSYYNKKQWSPVTLLLYTSIKSQDLSILEGIEEAINACTGVLEPEEKKQLLFIVETAMKEKSLDAAIEQLIWMNPFPYEIEDRKPVYGQDEECGL